MDSPITLFNWIQRYLVQPQDLTQLQTSLIDNANAGWEGVGKAAVLDGFVPSFTGGLNVSLTPGIAVGPTGYFMGVTGTTAVTIASPSGNPCRTLIVARPLVTQSNPIANPIPPVETVYLNEDFGAQIVVLNGTPAAAPAYPATTYGDVILAGFRLPASASSLTEDNLDYSIKDALGKNAHGLKAVARWDQRCLVLPTGANTVSISPSQPTYANPPGVTYGGGARPLIFPRTSGVFTPSLTNLNFTHLGSSHSLYHLVAERGLRNDRDIRPMQSWVSKSDSNWGWVSPDDRRGENCLRACRLIGRGQHHRIGSGRRARAGKRRDVRQPSDHSGELRQYPVYDDWN